MCASSCLRLTHVMFEIFSSSYALRYFEIKSSVEKEPSKTVGNAKNLSVTVEKQQKSAINTQKTKQICCYRKKHREITSYNRTKCEKFRVKKIREKSQPQSSHNTLINRFVVLVDEKKIITIAPPPSLSPTLCKPPRSFSFNDVPVMYHASTTISLNSLAMLHFAFPIVFSIAEMFAASIAVDFVVIRSSPFVAVALP